VLSSIGVVWGVVQISGWTPQTWASPISARFAVEAPTLPSAISFDRDLALVGLLHILTYIGVFTLAVIVPQTGREVRGVLATIVVSATIMTLVAMASTALNRLSPYAGGSLRLPGGPGGFAGTFINANNYATYAGVSALAALCLGIPAPSGASRLTSSQRWRNRLLLLSGRQGLWLAAGAVLIIGVLLSGSRGGWFSLIAGILVIPIAYTRGIRRVATVLLLFAACFVIGATFPGGERLVGKVMYLVERGESARPLLYELTTGAIQLRPMLGWGLNCFVDLYTVFQPASLTLLFDKAHNTYLELALDLGIPVAVALVLAVAVVAARCAKGFAIRSRDRELPMLGVAATILVGLHALADFSLQIPGMACTYFTLLGLAWNQSWGSRSGTGKSKTSLVK
jgi:O-antigen ligase